MVAVLAAVVGLGVVAIAQGSLEWSLLTMLVGFSLAQIPATLARMASMARIQGRWRRARYLTLSALCFQPTARLRVLYRAAREVALVRARRRTTTEAVAALDALGPVVERLGDMAVDLFHREALFACHVDPAGVIRLYEALGPVRFGVPWRAGAAYHVVTALCDSGRRAEAAAVVDAMQTNARGGEGAPAECDAYLNRARVVLLSFFGQADAVHAALGASSTLRALFRGDEARALRRRATVAPPNDAEAEPAVRAAARAVRAEAQLPSDLGHLRSPAPATLAIVLLLTAVWLAEAATGSSLDPLHLFWLGGALRESVLGGAWWRLVTSMFLHAGVLHLVLNAYFLLVFGNIAERLLGTSRFLLVYLCAGLCGSLAHIGFGADVVMVGASGAIFGVFGAAFAAVRAARDRLPVRWYRRHTAIFLATIGLNVYLSVSLPFVSLSAHAGGFLVGFALAALLVRRAHAAPQAVGALATAAWTACLGYAAFGLAGALAVPATETVPLEDATFEVATEGAVATVALPYPVTWRQGVEVTTEGGHLVVGVSVGECLVATVECGPDAPPCPEPGSRLRCVRTSEGRLVIAFHLDPHEIVGGDPLVRRIGERAALRGCRPDR